MTGKESIVGNEGAFDKPLLPEWAESDLDEQALLEAMKASRQEHFSELASL